VSSFNGGASWSITPTVIDEVCADPSNSAAMVGGPQVVVGPQGELYAAWEASAPRGEATVSRQIRIAKSTDGGVSFGAAAVVSSVTPVGNGADLQGFVRASESPSRAIGKGEKDSGFLYVIWNDGSNNAQDLLSTTSSYGFADVKFAVSQDGGASWSAPVRVNDNQEGNGQPFSDQFQPSIAADKNGRLTVCFYDRRRDPRNFMVDRECASSTNGGVNWRNARVTASNYPSTVGQDVLVARDYKGDYDGLASDSLDQSTGFVGSYASNAAGNPNVMTNQL
jgi:hypothetical protein